MNKDYTTLLELIKTCSIINSVNSALLIVDTELNIIEANKTALTLLGSKDINNLKSKSIKVLLSESDYSKLFLQLYSNEPVSCPLSNNKYIIKCGDEVRHINITALPVEGSNSSLFVLNLNSIPEQTTNILDIQKHTTSCQLLSILSNEMNLATDLNNLISRFSNFSENLKDCLCGSIYLYNPSNDDFELKSIFGVRQEFLSYNEISDLRKRNLQQVKSEFGLIKKHINVSYQKFQKNIFYVLGTLYSGNELIGMLELVFSSSDHCTANFLEVLISQYGSCIKRMLVEDKLKKSELQYKSLFENANDAFIVADAITDNIINVNHKACEIYGYKKEELIGMNLNKLSVDYDADSKTMKHNLQQSGSFTFETQHFKSNGETLNILLSCSLTEFQGKHIIILINRDVTSERLAESKITWNEALLRYMTEGTRMGFYVVNNHNEIIYVNDRFCELWKIKKNSADNITNKQIISHCYEMVKEPEKFVHSFIGLNDTENNIIFEDDIELKDERTIKRFSSQLKDNLNRYIGRLYVYEDITQRKLMESILQSEKEYQTIINDASDAIIISDELGKIMLANSKACQMFGYPGEEFSLLTFIDLIEPSNYIINPPKLDELAEGKSILIERILKRKDGSFFAAEISAKNITAKRTMGIIRDVTSRRSQSEEIKKELQAGLYEKIYLRLKAFNHGESSAMNLNRISLYVKNFERLFCSTSEGFSPSGFIQFKNLVSEYNTIVYTQLEHLITLLKAFEPEMPKLDLQTQFHELNEKLYKQISNLRTNLNLTASLNINSITSKQANEIKKDISNAIKNLKDIIKVISTMLTSYFTSDINNIIGSIVKMYSFLTDEINITFYPPKNPLNIIMNPNELREVIAIFFENAFESLFSSGVIKKQIHIDVFEKDLYAEIYIEDNGKGVAEKIKSDIFKAGFSTKGTSRGFGLSYAEKCIQKYGGSLRLDDKYINGARFIIQLKNMN